MIECNCMIPVMNYGSSASYKAEPTPEQIANGVIPLDSLPAAWWNCMWSQTNTAVNQARDELGQLITELNNVLCNAGVCPQDTCTDQLYQSINKIRQTLANASVAGAVKSSDVASEVNVNQTTGIMTVNCLGNAASLTTTARTVVGAVNELKSTYDCCFTDVNTTIGGKAPTAHASTATTYGVGNADCYGHLKISDTYTSVLSACSGVAASQMAVACVYCYAAGVAAGVAALGNTNGCALGTAAAGTATTAARSDHVHPTTGLATVKCESGYFGLGAAGDCSTWLRTPKCGFIPYVNCSTGASCLGTSSWPFLAAYAKTFYGALCGNATTATCATSATTALCTCLDYYSGSADRPIIVSSASNTATACQAAAIGPVVSANKFTYNPATGQLKLVSCGKTACISHLNASYLHIYTDAPAIAFNQDVYLPDGKYICRAKYACCASYNGSGTAFGTAATCAATAFRSCTWWPNSTSCGCVCYSSYADTAIDACWARGADCACCSFTGRGISTYGRKSNFTHCGVTFTYHTCNYGTVFASIPANSNYLAFIWSYHCCGSCKCYCGPTLLYPSFCCPLGIYWCYCADNEIYKKVSVFCISF